MARSAPSVASSAKLTLRDRLSRLTFLEASKLLGPEGQRLIQQNANTWLVQLPDDVHLGDDLFRLRLGRANGEVEAIVTMTLMAEARNRVHYRCDRCDGACDHIGRGVLADP